MEDEKLNQVVEPKKKSTSKVQAKSSTAKKTSISNKASTSAAKKSFASAKKVTSEASNKSTSIKKTTTAKKSIPLKNEEKDSMQKVNVEEIKNEQTNSTIGNLANAYSEEKKEEVILSASLESSEHEITGNNSVNEVEAKEDVVFNAEKQERRQKALKIVGQIVIYIFLIIFAVIVLFPFYFMIISSLKTEAEYNQSIPTLWVTMSAPQWQNYIECLNYNGYNLGRYMLNTVIVGVVSTILSLVLTILSAYAFARLKFKGRDALFGLLLGTMMIPGELFTITNYATVYSFNWINTYTVLIVPFLVSVFYIYLLRQNFKQIPDQLYYAAKVDGTSDFKYLWKVMIPLAAPSIVSITILKLMGSWNSYLWPQLVCTDKNMLLITNGLRSAFSDSSSGMTNYPLQMAACFVVSIPLFIVFICFRKYIMKGVSKSGIKG